MTGPVPTLTPVPDCDPSRNRKLLFVVPFTVHVRTLQLELQFGIRLSFIRSSLATSNWRLFAYAGGMGQGFVELTQKEWGVREGLSEGQGETLRRVLKELEDTWGWVPNFRGPARLIGPEVDEVLRAVYRRHRRDAMAPLDALKVVMQERGQTPPSRAAEPPATGEVGSGASRTDSAHQEALQAVLREWLDEQKQVMQEEREALRSRWERQWEADLRKADAWLQPRLREMADRTETTLTEFEEVLRSADWETLDRRIESVRQEAQGMARTAQQVAASADSVSQLKAHVDGLATQLRTHEANLDRSLMSVRQRQASLDELIGFLQSLLGWWPWVICMIFGLGVLVRESLQRYALEWMDTPSERSWVLLAVIFTGPLLLGLRQAWVWWRGR